MSKRIAVLGASTDRGKYGNKCVRAYDDAGWEVLPVNPGADEIEGHEVYGALDDVPGELDRISVYLPPTISRRELDAMARFEGATVFFNPGSADDAVIEEAREKGIDVRDACSIVDIGKSPSDYPD